MLDECDSSEKFKNKSNVVHSNKFDYSLVDFKGLYIKVKIICPIHGVFEQKPYLHLIKKKDCPKCQNTKNHLNLNTDAFVKKSLKIRGGKYDHSLVEYVDLHTPIKLICKEHGVFEIIPKKYLYSKLNCPKCSKVNKINKEVFIIEGNKTHNNKFDYSLVNYINSKSKVKIICPTHGVFEQSYNNHVLNKYGCPRCSNKKTSQSEFEDKANFVHNNKFDYSLAQYKSLNTLVKIICPTHGIFEMTPKDHIHSKKNCPKCAKNIKDTNESFKIKANKVHQFEFDYSLVEYKGSGSKVKIICLTHGVFEMTPNAHINGKQGCPKCGGCFKDTDETFKNKANIVRNNKFDYSLVVYKNSRSLVEIICPIHGTFKTTPDSHLNKKYGCPKCGKEAKRVALAFTTDKFKKIATRIHKKEFDYSLSNYVNMNTPVDIICPIHGVFSMNPASHIYDKAKCPKCMLELKVTQEVLLKRAVKTHGDRYDYSLVNYIDRNKKVEIICKKHGAFKQSLIAHVTGQGCPICKISKGEEMIRVWLKENNINFIPQHKFKDCKRKKVLPFDFYLPELNICIEYDGIQHFKPISRFGGEKSFSITKETDEIKTDYCKKNKIKLIRFNFKEDVLTIKKELEIHLNRN